MTHARKNAKANISSTLSVHSRLPYFFSSLPDCEIVPAVDCSSSRVPSTFADEATNVSSVSALFCVVSDKCLDIESILSVTLSCCDMRLDRLCREVTDPRCRSSVSPPAASPSALPTLKSSCFSSFSISNIVDMFALRNACKVLHWKINQSRYIGVDVS